MMAARIGDMTAHGGSITLGMPTVLIGGMPAARIGDLHVCPMVTPAGPAPIPHVGGPISGPGSPTVLIGGMPAAKMGDMLVCTGPPDSIVMGCPTVMIGMSGSGSGSAGSAGGGPSAAQAAQAAANAAVPLETTDALKDGHWFDALFVDKAGLPVDGVPFRLEEPDGEKTHGTLRASGRVVKAGYKEAGEAGIVLESVAGAAWSAEKVKPGETVMLNADTEGFDDGAAAEFEIVRQELSGPDTVIARRHAEVQADALEAEWAYAYEGDVPAGYSRPRFYFVVHVGPLSARSGVLDLDDSVEIRMEDADGRPLRSEAYVLEAGNGEVRRGTLDGQGTATEGGLPPGQVTVTFPDLQAPPDVQPDDPTTGA